jgi:hypothetical protein
MLACMHHPANQQQQFACLVATNMKVVQIYMFITLGSPV